jgi:hypothetical protein
MPVPESDTFARALEGSFLGIADIQPASTTTLQTNKPQGYVSIVLPGEGNLWVYFVPQGLPAARAWLWDQKTLFTEIKPNVPQVLATRKGDRLVYELGAPTQQITLSWGYE